MDWAAPDMAAAGQALALAGVEAERGAEEPEARVEVEPELVALAAVEPAGVAAVYGNPGPGAVAVLAVRDGVASGGERGSEAVAGPAVRDLVGLEAEQGLEAERERAVEVVVEEVSAVAQ